MKKILVGGAGHGGLSAAIVLARKGYDVTVVESKYPADMGYDWHDTMPGDTFEYIGIDYPEEYEPSNRMAYVAPDGKTKVIMKAIDRVLEDGKNVIMLVPEIALTPQTLSIFCRRYGERVAVIHSALSQGERQDAYRRIKRGDVDLVFPDCLSRGKNLPVDVGQADGIVIHKIQSANAASYQRLHYVAAHTAQTEYGNAGIF